MPKVNRIRIVSDVRQRLNDERTISSWLVVDDLDQQKSESKIKAGEAHGVHDWSAFGQQEKENRCEDDYDGGTFARCDLSELSGLKVLVVAKKYSEEQTVDA